MVVASPLGWGDGLSRVVHRAFTNRRFCFAQGAAIGPAHGAGPGELEGALQEARGPRDAVRDGLSQLVRIGHLEPGRLIVVDVRLAHVGVDGEGAQGLLACDVLLASIAAELIEPLEREAQGVDHSVTATAFAARNPDSSAV